MELALWTLQTEPRRDIGKTNMLAFRRRMVQVLSECVQTGTIHTDAVVLYGKVQHVVVRTHAYLYGPASFLRGESVFESVFHQGLEDERGGSSLR